MINDIAATVSVAQRTLLSMRIYLKFNILKKRASKKVKKAVRHKKPIIVAAIPRKLIIPKF